MNQEFHFSPRLRFSEFEESLKHIGFSEVGKIMIGLTHTPEYLEGGIPFLSSKNISKSTIDFTNVQYISEEKYKSMPTGSKPLRGDILFTRVGSNLGNPKVLEKEIQFGIFVSLGIFRVNNKANNYFIKYWMDSNYFWRQLERKVAGGAKNNLNTTWLKEFKLNLPTIDEQQKIASFLTAVDTKTLQLERKKKLLQQYKKGVMQQIFSQEIRFTKEDGSSYPDWEEKTLGMLGEIVTGKTPNTSRKDLWNGDIQFITPTDIHEENKYQISTSRTVVNSGKLKILPAKSIVYTCIASIGKIALSVYPCITNQQINALVPKKDFDCEFIYYALLKITPRIKSTQANTTLPIINKTEFSKFKIDIPSLEEQISISNYLAVIDKKIELVATQIRRTKTFKKGLLQQMFV